MEAEHLKAFVLCPEEFYIHQTSFHWEHVFANYDTEDLLQKNFGKFYS